MMKKDYIIATFMDDEKVMDATKKVVSKNINIFDIYTPFPVHGLDEAMGIKRSILPYVTLVAGLTGGIIAFAGMSYIFNISWPINIGGKPFMSIPSFIPITFEMTVLFGAHTTVAAFLALNKLFPGKQPVIIDPGQTEDKFIMAIDKDETNVDDITALLKENGAVEVRVQNIDLSI
jgi:hypothetical protein